MFTVILIKPQLDLRLKTIYNDKSRVEQQIATMFSRFGYYLKSKWLQ